MASGPAVVHIRPTVGVTSSVPSDLVRHIPFEVLDALRQFAWHAAWFEAVARAMMVPGSIGQLISDSEPLDLKKIKASSGILSLPVELSQRKRRELREDAALAWSICIAKGPEFCRLDQDTLQDLNVMVTHAAQHCSACKISPIDRKAAKVSYAGFDAARKGLGHTERPLHSALKESLVNMIWDFAWTAATTIADHQKVNSGKDDNAKVGDGVDGEADFGDDYMGESGDALSSFCNGVRHATECFWDHSRWMGLALETHLADQATARSAKAAGFNVLRLPVPVLASVAAQRNILEEVSAGLVAAAAAGLSVVLDLDSWGGSKDKDIAQLASQVQIVASAAKSHRCVRGVVLPHASLKSAKPLVSALRKGGLTPGWCAAILPLDDLPTDDDGNYIGSLGKALKEGEVSLFWEDAHIVLEFSFRFKDERRNGPRTLAKASHVASHIGDGLVDFAPCSVCAFGLVVPKTLAAQAASRCTQWFEELAARQEGAAGDATHGWFASLTERPSSKDGKVQPGGQNQLRACLQRTWGWPDCQADRIFWPHSAPHCASLIWLTGFTCPASCYLAFPEDFCRSLAPGGGRIDCNGAKEVGDAIQAVQAGKIGKGRKEGKHHAEATHDEQDDDNEEEELALVPFQGLKCIFMASKELPISAYRGEKSLAWYDYLTDHGGKTEDDFDAESLEESVARVHRVLAEEAGKVGSHRVFIGGSSQGCATALHAALTYRGAALGGVAGCMGHLLTATPVEQSWIVDRTCPVFVYNGLADDCMPWKEWVKPTWDRLVQRGADVRIVTEEGVDHGDGDREGAWCRDFLARTFGAQLLAEKAAKEAKPVQRRPRRTKKTELATA